MTRVFTITGKNTYFDLKVNLQLKHTSYLTRDEFNEKAAKVCESCFNAVREYSYPQDIRVRRGRI